MLTYIRSYTTKGSDFFGMIDILIAGRRIDQRVIRTPREDKQLALIDADELMMKIYKASLQA